MTAVIHFKPLCGALNDDPFMYWLTIDECKILLDCGWNDSFDLKLLEPLKAYVLLFSTSEIRELRLTGSFLVSPLRLTLSFYHTRTYTT